MTRPQVQQNSTSLEELSRPDYGRKDLNASDADRHSRNLGKGDLTGKATLADFGNLCLSWHLEKTDTEKRESSTDTIWRNLGPTEKSYYLGSRSAALYDDAALASSGVNDMYLHLGFRITTVPVALDDILVDIWTTLLLKHVLLASEVQYTGQNQDVRFLYRRPTSIEAARTEAKTRISILTQQDPRDVIEKYLNGPRTLCDKKLSHVVIILHHPPSSSFLANESPESLDPLDCDFILFTTHFIGDGMALHMLANEFFTSLGNCLSRLTEHCTLVREVDALNYAPDYTFKEPGTAQTHFDFLEQENLLPESMEYQLIRLTKLKKLKSAIGEIDYKRYQQKQIGGQTFESPNVKIPVRQRTTVSAIFTSRETQKIINNCKSHGVTIAQAVFALANIAFIRSQNYNDLSNKEYPCLFYSAVNMRPSLPNNGDFQRIAIGFYNIILPSFLIKGIPDVQTFWHRALSARKQVTSTVKSPFLKSRTLLAALDRERRSQKFTSGIALQCPGIVSKGPIGGISSSDSAYDRGLGEKACNGGSHQEMKDSAAAFVYSKTSQKALMGLSMLGNLDTLYAHETYPNISLHTLTTGSRQRSGAILLFSFTFKGKFCLSLGYDQNAFLAGSIESWWQDLRDGVDEFLLSSL